MCPAASIARRPIAGTALDTSVVGLVVGPPAAMTGVADRSTVTLLRKARASGVTTFDLAGSHSPPWAAQVLLTAFPDPDPEIVVIVGHRAAPSSGPSLPGSMTRSTSPPAPREGDPARQFEEMAARLSRVGRVLLDWDPGEESDRSSLEGGPWPDDLVGRGTIAGWSVRCRPNEEPRGEGTLRSRLPVSAEFSLLDTRLLGTLSVRFRDTPGAVLGRDPFAGGRLDGTRFSARLSERSPTSTPADVRTLHAEFDPVLRLAPLTRDRRRTLAQAAVQYVVRWPWVATVLVPLPGPERWEEIRGALDAPPLDETELGELGLLPPTTASLASSSRP